MSENKTLYDDLCGRIANREAVLIVGAGVSISATGNSQLASWKGLLENGIDRCVDVAALETPLAENLKRQLDSSDADAWLSVAQLVETKLKRRSGEFGLWLEDTVGALEVTDPQIVKALANLNLPIYTTNYDGVLEQIIGAPAVTWRQKTDFERVIRGQKRAIVHLHGLFSDPDTVVLGISSYEDVLRDECAQAMLHALRSTRTLIFVGFGKGLKDPNFGALLNWSRNAFSASPYRHFRLARQSECQDLQDEHDPDDRVFVVSYGVEYSDLLPFLESVSPSKRTADQHYKIPEAELPAPEVTQQQILESFHAEIDLAKDYTKRGQPDVAIALLEKLRTRHSSDFNNRIWFRVLANIGHAYEAKEEFEKVATLYLQAKDYEPDSVEAQCFGAIAYFLRGENTKAFSLAADLRRRHAQSSLAHTVWIRSAPDSITLVDLERDVPEHFRQSQDVAHALMVAAVRENEFDKAEVYGRKALAEDPESPIQLEQLGDVLLGHARHRLLEIEADVPPTKVRDLARDAANLLKNALDARDERGPASAKARLHMSLAMAHEILGSEDDSQRHLRLAYDTDPNNHEIITRFAVSLGAQKEYSAAIALLTRLLTEQEHTPVRYLLANLYLSRNESADREAGAELLSSLVSDLDSLVPSARFDALRNLLLVYADDRQDEKASQILDQLTDNQFPPIVGDILRAAYLHKCGRTDVAKNAALNALSQSAESTEFIWRRVLARELTRQKLYMEAHSLWKGIVTPTYVGLDTQMTVASARYSDEAEFLLNFCEQLRANGFYDNECVWAELDVLNRYNCIDARGRVMVECLSGIDDDDFRRELRVNHSLLGLELGRHNWVTHDPSQLPSATDVSACLGRTVVQLLSCGPDSMQGLHYAYELLRRNFESKDANMAMIGSVLIGKQHRLKIPEFEEVMPGVAVAYKEDDAEEPRWWIIEDAAEPNRARRELDPDHPLAQRLRGKKVGDEFAIRESSLQNRVARIVEIQSKYVYRFQKCMQEFEEYFPGETFLMQFSTKRSDTDEPDLEPIFRSVDQRIEWTRSIEREYMRLLPSMNHFAQRTKTHVLDAAAHLATEPIPIRCCTGRNDELDKASTALKTADTIVLDGSALATLFLTQAYRHLNEFSVRITVSYGTLRAIRQLHMERLSSGGQGFLTKIGDQFVFREHSESERQRYRDELGEFIETLESVAVIEEGRAYSSIAKDDRETIDKAFGRPCGESIALATRQNRVLWLDDLPVAQLASTSYGINYAWTQELFSHACEQGWLDDDTLAAISLKLLRFQYTTTRVVPEFVTYAGTRAEWSLEDSDLSAVLSWFGNGDVKPESLAWVVSKAIASILADVEDHAKAETVVAALLLHIKTRHDGADLLKQFREAVDTAWKETHVDVECLKSLINQTLVD